MVEFEVEGFKAFSKSVTVVLRPLTIVVGRNNSGKSALARALPLLAGGLGGGQADTGSAALPLLSFGLRHGSSFDDLVHRRTAHGWVRLAARFALPAGEARLDVRVQNVGGLSAKPQPVITRWILSSPEATVDLERASFEPSEAEYRLNGPSRALVQVRWEGLRPVFGSASGLALPAVWQALIDWSGQLTYLRSPRVSVESPFRASDRDMATDGGGAAQRLHASDGLLEKVRAWFQGAFDCRLAVRTLGEYLDIEASQPDGTLLLGALGQGLTQVLPVVVRLLERGTAPGVDIIEHPEAELHPGVHAAVADLVLASLQDNRPLVIETHSEMLLLRVRRWIAQGMSPEKVAIYWIDQEGPERIRRVQVRETGEVERWPEGVFNEDYDEILAIRRAARGRQGP